MKIKVKLTALAHLCRVSVFPRFYAVVSNGRKGVVWLTHAEPLLGLLSPPSLSLPALLRHSGETRSSKCPTIAVARERFYLEMP